MKRSRFEIMVDILSSAKEGVNKTKVVYEAYLNFKQAEDYLNFLMEAELISTDSNGNQTIYQTTDKGLEMMERYKDLIELNP
ncbi:MAG: DUF4364 family protein [Archaeoglobaceae archaeon]